MRSRKSYNVGTAFIKASQTGLLVYFSKLIIKSYTKLRTTAYNFFSFS